jgi:hypothetical protein
VSNIGDPQGARRKRSWSALHRHGQGSWLSLCRGCENASDEREEIVVESETFLRLVVEHEEIGDADVSAAATPIAKSLAGDRWSADLGCGRRTRCLCLAVGHALNAWCILRAIQSDVNKTTDDKRQRGVRSDVA